MKKFKSLMSKGVMCTTCTVAIIFTSSYVPVSANPTNKESLIILLDTEMKNEIDKIERKFPNVQVHMIEEINSLVVNDIDKKQLPNIRQYMNKKLDIPTENIVNNVEIAIQDPIANIHDKTAKQSLLIENEEAKKYDKWMWDIKQVTNNYESHVINPGSHDVKVGIIDSGVDFHHPDLKQNILNAGKSFVPDDTSTQDNLGHGTMVAGTIAANGKVKGVGPNIGIVPYKVFNQKGGDSSWIIEAIIQAAKDDMDVVNLSLGTFKSIKKEEDKNLIEAYRRAFAYAKEHNTVLVASSGNEGVDISDPQELAKQLGKPEDLLVHLPGGEKDVITVAATDKESKLASYSNYGRVISISAPGGDYGPNFKEDKKYDVNSLVLAPYPMHLPQTPLGKNLGFEQGYELMLGTSLAVPKVTATVAVMKDEYFKKFGKEMTNEEVESTLYRNADQPNHYNKDTSGEGIVNLYRVLMDIRSR